MGGRICCTFSFIPLQIICKSPDSTMLSPLFRSRTDLLRCLAVLTGPPDETVKCWRCNNAPVPDQKNETPSFTVLKETALIHSNVARHQDAARPRASGRSPCVQEGCMEAHTRLHSLIFLRNHAGWLCEKKRLLALQRCFP